MQDQGDPKDCLGCPYLFYLFPTDAHCTRFKVSVRDYEKPLRALWELCKADEKCEKISERWLHESS